MIQLILLILTNLGLSQVNPIKKVVFTKDDTCLLFETGSVKCWGKNDLGISNPKTANTPIELPKAIEELKKVTDIQTASTFVCALNDQGEVSCWGRLNPFTRHIGPSHQPDIIGIEKFQTSAPVKQMAVGLHHICVLLQNNEVECMGLYNPESKIMNFKFDRPIKKLTSTHHQSCALLEDSDVQCIEDLVGKEEICKKNKNCLKPKTVYSPITPIKDIAGHCILFENGSVTCPLPPKYSTTEHFVYRDEIIAELGKNVIGLANYNGHHTCVILKQGEVVCWGTSFSGQSGILVEDKGINVHVKKPQKINNVKDVSSLMIGDGISCAKLNSGEIKCWGSGFKILGNGDQNHITPYNFSSQYFVP